MFDPLVFPCATGDENYIGGAVETMEGIRLIKQALPDTRTILGISNVSFGLPAAAREVVNSVFLYYCTKAGLDLAIVNTEKIERFASIPEQERKLAENLLFSSSAHGLFPQIIRRRRCCAMCPRTGASRTRSSARRSTSFILSAITEHFRTAKKKTKAMAADLPLDERLANYIVEGTRDGLIEDLDRKRAEGAAPLDIVNGPLMAGMSEVGRLFNANELIVAEVLQSAEAMKAAVGHLEQFMEKADTAKRGRVVLATVKGDVHDIGKNLVEIILKNNGYDVVNLGIKVPPDVLIKAYEEHKPDAIGLSGLLVKSAQQMVITASDLKDAGVEIPLLVGGAALSAKFTQQKIAPSYGKAVCYAKDAMTGLRLMNELMDPATREKVLQPAHYRLPDNGVVRLDDGARGGDARAGALAEGAHRSADSQRGASRSQGAHRARSARSVVLHQSVHALRPAHGLQGRLREAAGAARSEGAGTVWQHGRSEERSGRIHEGSRSVAILRGRAGRQRTASVRAGRHVAAAHVPVPAAARR